MESTESAHVYIQMLKGKIFTLPGLNLKYGLFKGKLAFWEFKMQSLLMFVLDVRSC